MLELGLRIELAKRAAKVDERLILRRKKRSICDTGLAISP